MNKQAKKINNLKKEKAAKLLNKAVKRIKKVYEVDGKCCVETTDHCKLTIPYEVWTLGMSEQEYTEMIFSNRSKRNS